MMIKFLAHGTGSAAKAADYLTRERFPAQDQEQDQDQEKNLEEVKVLRGNPNQVAAGHRSRRGRFLRKYRARSVLRRSSMPGGGHDQASRRRAAHHRNRDPGTHWWSGDMRLTPGAKRRLTNAARKILNFRHSWRAAAM